MNRCSTGALQVSVSAANPAPVIVIFYGSGIAVPHGRSAGTIIRLASLHSLAADIGRSMNSDTRADIVVQPPLHPTLMWIPTTCFVGTLLTDIVYYRTAEM